MENYKIHRCEKCNYFTARKEDLKRHEQSKRHLETDEERKKRFEANRKRKNEYLKMYQRKHYVKKWSYKSLVAPENRIKPDFTNMDEVPFAGIRG